METVFSEDDCVFCPSGVCCPDGPSSECSHCGWNPRIAQARADRIRRKLAGGGATPSTASRSPSLKEGGKKGGGGDV